MSLGSKAYSGTILALSIGTMFHSGASLLANSWLLEKDHVNRRIPLFKASRKKRGKVRR